MRPDWDAYFFGLAAAVATRADCTRRQVGAVIVSPDRRVMGTGYNGAPSGQPGCASAGACPRGQRTYDQVASRTPYEGAGHCIAVHAEVNAVLFAQRDVRGCTLYVTCAPCSPCAQVLAAVGIVDIRVSPSGQVQAVLPRGPGGSTVSEHT